MDDNRPVKALMYGELDKSTRPVGRPKLRYKDTCKTILKSGRILDQWQDLVVNRPLWRRTIGNVCGNVDGESNCDLPTTKGAPSSKESYKWKLIE